MILFVASWDASDALRRRCEDAIRDVAATVPSLAGAALSSSAVSGPAGVVWCRDDSVASEVVDSPERIALLEGIVLGEGGVLGARAAVALEGVEVDGHYAVVTATPTTLEIRSDALRMCPLYFARIDGAWFVANRVETLARVAGDRELDLEAAATFITGGWPHGDRTLSPSVRCVPGGASWRWTKGRTPDVGDEGLGFQRLRQPPRAVDASMLAQRFVAWMSGASAWAGSLVVPITGGLDSRVLLAVTRAAGVDATFATSGTEESPDVRIARQLAAIAGVRHVVSSPAAQVVDGWTELAARLVRENDGMVSLWQAADVIDRAPEHRLVVWGAGGEIARGFYMRPQSYLPDASSRARARFVAERTSMGHSLARPEARAESERQAGAFFDDARAAGLRAVDVNDAFYALQRVARWASANARKTAPATQLAPFATGLFVDAAWGVPTVVRYSSPLHWQVLDHLAPDLAAVPLAKGKRRTLLPYLNLAQSAARRLRRPSGGAGGPAPQVEWLETLRHDFAATCEELDRAAVWDVVDREALLRLLLDDDPQARRRDGEAIYGVMTLLEHERSRTVA